MELSVDKTLMKKEEKVGLCFWAIDGYLGLKNFEIQGVEMEYGGWIFVKVRKRNKDEGEEHKVS